MPEVICPIRMWGDSMSQAKRNTLLYLAAGGMLLIILAMSLPSLVLAPAQDLPLPTLQNQSTAPAGGLPAADLVVQFAQGVMALSLIALPIIIIHSLLTPGG